MTEPNPMQALLRRQLGVDLFALDGDDTRMDAEPVLGIFDPLPRRDTTLYR